MPRPAMDLPEKCCERCNKAIQRKRYGERLEDATAFLKRRFCSLSCANTRGNWGESSTATRREAHKSVSAVCNRCGKSGRNHVHHKDKNPRNNQPTNLETLCPSCHKIAHLSGNL